MKTLIVKPAQAKKNREGIQELWKRIPTKWIDLDTYLGVHGDRSISRDKLVVECDGKDGPHNTCGAVGCFAGWNWTYHPYQQWCKRNKVEITSVYTLDIYLGLHQHCHRLWASRQDHEITVRAEVKQRISKLMILPYVTWKQECLEVGDQ
tara:strand:+ start:6778 stop:7227 length:450 start_codon:yes stop_codon:yes gene_type:complete